MKMLLWLVLYGALLILGCSYVVMSRCACLTSSSPKTTPIIITEQCGETEGWLARTNCILDIVEAYYTDGRYGAHFWNDTAYQYHYTVQCLFSLPADPVSLK